MSCKLCLEFNENSLEFSSDDAIQKNIVETLRKYFPFCFKDDESEGFVCEKCWWKVEIFDSFYISIELLHQNTIFADALIKFSQSDQLQDQDSDTNTYKIEEPVCILTEQNASVTKLIETRSDEIASSSNCPRTVPEYQIQKRRPSKEKLNVHKKKQLIQCDLCDHTTTLYEMKMHKKLAHSDATQSTTKNQSKLKSNLPQNQPLKIARTNEDTSPVGHATQFPCTEPTCGTTQIFFTQKQLNRHHREEHLKTKCDLCNKYYRNHYLPVHKKHVHSNTLQTICYICGLSCKTDKSYKVHYETVHSEQQRVQCDLCQLWLKNKGNFRNHYVHVHMASDPVTCQTCGVIMRNKRLLVSHERIHRPGYRESFKCTVCGRGFGKKSRYREHMANHSNSRDKRQCTVCGRQFNSQTGFQEHLCTTPKERIYKCPYCDRTYSYSSGVRTHIGRSHQAEEDNRKATIEMEKLANLEKIKTND